MELMRKLVSRLSNIIGIDRRAATPEKELGGRGEREAVKALKRSGYTILERNFRARGGEIDVIAFRDGVVAFVEVKTRTEPAEDEPFFSLGTTKQSRVANAAGNYCQLRGLDKENVVPRFDVMVVRLDSRYRVLDVRHIEDAFRP